MSLRYHPGGDCVPGTAVTSREIPSLLLSDVDVEAVRVKMTLGWHLFWGAGCGYGRFLMDRSGIDWARPTRHP